MDYEIINRVEILGTGELLLGIEGRGKPVYQYVYREAAGVHWDEKRCGFTSTPIKAWTCHQWFTQIVNVVKSCLGIELLLGGNVAWINISEQQKQSILRG